MFFPFCKYLTEEEKLTYYLTYYQDSSVKISNVKFINFKGTCNKTDAITLDCSTSGFGCKGVQLVNVNIKGRSGEKPQAKCTNADVKARKINLKLGSCKRQIH